MARAKEKRQQIKRHEESVPVCHKHSSKIRTDSHSHTRSFELPHSTSTGWKKQRFNIWDKNYGIKLLG